MRPRIQPLERRDWRRSLSVFVLPALGAALALSGRPVTFVAALTVVLGYLWLVRASVRDPVVLAVAILITLEVLPPLYFDSLGETPLYVSFLLLPAALVVAVLGGRDMDLGTDPVTRGLAAFMAGTAVSLPFAFWLSGVDAGIHAVSRWALLAHAPVVFWLIRSGARPRETSAERVAFRVLMTGAVLSAAYGILDFVWPLPLPHPSAEQFVWLQGAVVRRAQGPFYESSSFASFCGVFLVAAAAAWLGRRERSLSVSRLLLLLYISILGLAILVAFSRSTWVALLTALTASVMLSRFARLPRVIPVLIALAIPAGLLWMLSPELWEYLVTARLGRLFDIFVDPNSATSGRVETWLRVLSIMRAHPQYLVFGIGYKTLPVTHLFRSEIITDNGYLSLLMETGVVGLGGFLAFSGAVLGNFRRLARSASDELAFWSNVLFSVWCGELVLFLAADAYTYWRNITVMVALMALTLNLEERGLVSGAKP